MSEKRFTFATNEKWFLFDNETKEFMDMEDCKDKLNKQQADLNYLARFIGEFKVEEFRLKLRNLRMLENKIDEQQATIDKQERRIIVLKNLLTNMGVKWVDDDV